MSQPMLWTCALLAGCVGAALALETGDAMRASPEMAKLLEPAAKVEKLAAGFKFVEGPVWTPHGNLLFSDIPNDVVLAWNAETKKVTDFRRPSGQTNGNTLDKQGRLVSCEHAGRRVVRREMDGKITVLADSFNGKKLNSPNDLVYKSDGALYFTDPPYGLPKQDADPGKEQAFNGVYRLQDGKVTLVAEDLSRPNGLAFSPDEKTLYVANSDEARKLWMAYPVNADGTLGTGKVLLDVTGNKEDGLPDGLRVDKLGNVWATGPAGVWVISPSGKHLGTVIGPEVPANCAFGDTDGKTLYLTARTGLYRIRCKVAGH